MPEVNTQEAIKQLASSERDDSVLNIVENGSTREKAVFAKEIISEAFDRKNVGPNILRNKGENARISRFPEPSGRVGVSPWEGLKDIPQGETELYSSFISTENGKDQVALKVVSKGVVYSCVTELDSDGNPDYERALYCAQTVEDLVKGTKKANIYENWEDSKEKYKRLGDERTKLHHAYRKVDREHSEMVSNYEADHDRLGDHLESLKTKPGVGEILEGIEQEVRSTRSDYSERAVKREVAKRFVGTIKEIPESAGSNKELIAASLAPLLDFEDGVSLEMFVEDLETRQKSAVEAKTRERSVIGTRKKEVEEKWKDLNDNLQKHGIRGTLLNSQLKKLDIIERQGIPLTQQLEMGLVSKSKYLQEFPRIYGKDLKEYHEHKEAHTVSKMTPVQRSMYEQDKVQVRLDLLNINDGFVKEYASEIVSGVERLRERKAAELFGIVQDTEDQVDMLQGEMSWIEERKNVLNRVDERLYEVFMRNINEWDVNLEGLLNEFLQSVPADQKDAIRELIKSKVKLHLCAVAPERNYPRFIQNAISTLGLGERINVTRIRRENKSSIAEIKAQRLFRAQE